ncbi:MAG TPA: HEAT repeat domain-containing protein [Anaerovoracaceae bacterium]|nr:HEAT repeat domain-containing protein [Anaerovoracaceae bacterium]
MLKLSISLVPVLCGYSSIAPPVDSLLYYSVKTEEVKAAPGSELTQIDLKGFNTYSKDGYPIQVGAFRLKSNANVLLRIVSTHYDTDAKIIFEDGYYKVRIARIPGRKVTVYDKTEDSSKQVASVPQDSVVKKDTIQISAVYADTIRTTPVVDDTINITDKATSDVSNILFIKGDSPWLRRITYLGKSIALVHALIITIMVSIATMIILLIVIFLNRRKMEKEESLRHYLMEKYQSLIIDYLFGNAGPDDFRPIASDTYRRQVLIDQMIDVSANLKGDEGKKLLSLYKHLGLDKDSINSAYDHRWHKRVKGFRELAFMNIKDANGAIYKALNSSNEILRMEAQIALVQLSDSNPFDFLFHLKSPFSLWEQITLHELIMQHSIPPPSFKKWITSPNPTVVMFALRMIREFKQKDAENDIIEVLNHPSPEVRHLAIQVSGDLNMRSTLEPMKRMYKSQDYRICLEIVRSMGKMPDLSMMGFLKLVLDKEDDVQLQIEATKAIENNGEEGVKELVKLMKSEYKNYNIIVRHVLDRRIF